ncbi:MAG: LysM peptidoglycan-binding domain-containing protein [Chthoniobacteraceae bacterium]
MAFTQRPAAQAEDQVPLSKHQLRPTPAQVVQHGFEEQNKRLDQIAAQLTTLADSQKQLVDAQAKQLEALTQKTELQAKQIETLNDQLNRLNTALLSRPSAAPAPDTASHLSGPSVQTTAPAATTGDSSTPSAVKAEPVHSDAPNAAGQLTHVVKRGETLTTIARAHSTSVSELLSVNKIEDERKLQVGQTLILPKGATPQASPSASASTTPTPQNNP